MRRLILGGQANFLAVKAYQYTSFTSAQLLDGLTVPFVMALSRVALKTQYTMRQVLAMVLCLIGMAGLVYSDNWTHNGDSNAPPTNTLLGDGLMIAASVLYACTNVLEEYLLHSHSRTEVLAGIGLFGVILSIAQVAALEGNDLLQAEWTSKVVGLLAGFTLLLFSFYTGVPILIEASSATLFNLSMLAADVYSMLLGVLLLAYSFFWLYFVSFGVVLVGLALYTFPALTK